MTRSVFRLTVFVVGAALVCFGGWAGRAEAAADPWDGSRLGRSTFAQVWLGPDVEKDDLRGQVVLLEYWGYRCGPCIAAIPHMIKLNNKYGRGGLVVIGTHAQGDSGEAKGQAIAIANARRVNYTIMARVRVPETNFRGIPHAFVFDHGGKVVYEGHPSDGKMERAIVAAIRRRPHPILGEMRYNALSGAAAKVKAGRLGEAWQECKSKQGADGETGKEASFLFANIERYAKRLAAKAEKSKQDAPTDCVEALTRLKREFAGAPAAEEADKQLKAIAADKAFQTELKAEKQYLVVARAAGKIPPCPSDKAKRGNWVRRYGSGARQIKSRVERLKKQFPDSGFTKKAQDLLDGLLGEK